MTNSPVHVPESKPSAISVSELNRQVKRMLEVSYAQVWVTGELSSLARPSSGHWYFSLKDEKAQIKCAMFRGANQRLRFQPKEGDKVIVRGKLSLYEGRGDYQLIVDSMEPVGLGELQAAFDALKLKLMGEGLFDAQHKKALPKTPKRLCVITSRSGAVIHDIIHVAKRRFPALHISLIPVNVQGEGAAQEIANAIRLANAHQLADVLIVGRGGGSLEDLWAFNEELVARAIYESELPIISAVGHEVDVSIADMVADYRAPTPSAAAEYITPDQYELSQKLDDQQRRLSFLVRNKMAQATRSTNSAEKRIRHPGHLLEEKALRALSLEKELKQLALLATQKRRALVSQQETQMQRFQPKLQVERSQRRTELAFNRIQERFNQAYAEQTHRLSLAASGLHVVSPLATLERGYSIISDSSGKVIRARKGLKKGQVVEARLKDGLAQLEVLSTSKASK